MPQATTPPGLKQKIFDGSFGVYPHQTVHIALLPGSKLVHHHAYLVPQAHKQTFKKKLQHMVDIGILEECGASEWALPYFIVAKKDGQVSDKSLLSALSTNVLNANNIRHLLSTILCNGSQDTIFYKT